MNKREFALIGLSALAASVWAAAVLSGWLLWVSLALGGVFGYLDSVLERHSFDEFGELI